MIKSQNILVAVIVVVILAAIGYLLINPSQPEGSATSDARLEDVVKNVIRNNPEIIIESLEAYQAQQQEMADAKRGENIEELRQTIADSDNLTEIGNPEGDVLIVEFFDYQCGYCKRVFNDMINVVKEDQNVRLVFKELPILGPGSRLGAEAALAAKEQGKYFEFHTALMKHRGRVTEQIVRQVSNDLGLNYSQLKKDMKSDTVQKHLESNLDWANKLEVNGTPAFIIGERFIPGAIEADSFRTFIKQARES